MDVIRLLLANGADVNARDDWGRIPLHDCAAASSSSNSNSNHNSSSSRLVCCILLLQHGADPSARDSDGKTPVDSAAGDEATRLVLTGEQGLGKLAYFNARFGENGIF